jgi:hypothetical protein
LEILATQSDVVTKDVRPEPANVAASAVLLQVGGNKMLNKHYVRDGKRRIIASVTTGFSDTSTVVRDQTNQITGRTNERFHSTRDESGELWRKK